MDEKCALTLIPLLLALIACSPEGSDRVSSADNSGVAPIEARIMPNVAYGHSRGTALTFDLYQPAISNGAAVIFVASAGWRSQWDWRQFTDERSEAIRLLTRQELKQRYPRNLHVQYDFRPLLSEGFTIIAVRHGSSPKFAMVEIVAQVRDVVRYIKYYATRYQLDSERIGAWGGSAGGHLALLLGTTGDDSVPVSSGLFAGISSRVAAVVAYYPPSDLNRLVASWTPAQRQSHPAVRMNNGTLKAFSPLMFASSGDAPTLIVHGDRDGLVPFDEGWSMHQALRKAGVATEFLAIAGAGHGFFDRDADRAVAQTVNWFKKHLPRD